LKIRSHIRGNVIGYVALFVALSGVAYANDGPLAGQNTVGSADIIDGEVYNQDIKASSVGSGKVIDNSLTANDLAAKSVRYSELDPTAFASGDIAPACGLSGRCNYGIPLNAIQGNEIQDGQVTKADLASDVIPAGPAGYSAFDDDTGIICNASCTEGSLNNIPAGSYAIFGKLHIDQRDPDVDEYYANCRLHAGADFDDALVSQLGPGQSGSEGTNDLRTDTLNMQVVHTYASDGGKAYINCRDTDTGDAYGGDLKITAIRLGSLSNVPSDSGPDS
jgi:hypothetical protein